MRLGLGSALAWLAVVRARQLAMHLIHQGRIAAICLHLEAVTFGDITRLLIRLGARPG
jgi:hypothetical protein